MDALMAGCSLADRKFPDETAPGRSHHHRLAIRKPPGGKAGWANYKNNKPPSLEHPPAECFGSHEPQSTVRQKEAPTLGGKRMKLWDKIRSPTREGPMIATGPLCIGDAFRRRAITLPVQTLGKKKFRRPWDCDQYRADDMINPPRSRNSGKPRDQTVPTMGSRRLVIRFE